MVGAVAVELGEAGADLAGHHPSDCGGGFNRVGEWWWGGFDGGHIGGGFNGSGAGGSFNVLHPTHPHHRSHNGSPGWPGWLH